MSNVHAHKLATLPTLPSLLIVDDDPLIREGLAAAFSHDFHTHLAETRAAAIKLLRKLPAPPQLALIDLGLPPFPHRPDEGFQLITELLVHSPEIRIFVLSGQDEKSSARHARSLGAIDFIAKPCAPEKIKKYFDDALAIQNSEHKTEVQDGQTLGLVGSSHAIKALRSQISMYAAIPFPVLIEGESGCGKELVALALQKLGGSSKAPFKILNCAAVSPTLIEPTLFGYSKGAFTGATSAQSGFFEDASDGTLFLDEISELPLELQAKLLRVLENGDYQRVGETTTRKSHARIIAATNRNMREVVRAGTFRNDLYHRLNVFSIHVPPLRELGEDKLAMLEHFSAYYARQIIQATFKLDSDALRLWEQYSFPGNTRELRNIVIRLATKYPGQTIGAKQLQDEFDPFEKLVATHNDTSDNPHRIPMSAQMAAPPILTSNKPSNTMPEDSPENLLRLARERILASDFDIDHHFRQMEGYYFAAALELASGNISEAARLLGINRTTLHSRLGAHEKPHT